MSGRRPTSLVAWGKSIAVALAAWLVLRTFVIQAFHITSESMEGTLFAGDVLWVARPLYGAEVPFTGRRLPAIREPRRGDIVVFESVETPGLEVVKRVVGLPGDTIGMQGGVLIRNGVAVDEPYARHGPIGSPEPAGGPEAMRRWQTVRLVGPRRVPYLPDRNNWGPVVVPADSLFVLGDNRNHSWDGRYWGFLPRGNVHGGPLLIYYSFDPSSWRPLPLLTATRWQRLFTVPR